MIASLCHADCGGRLFLHVFGSTLLFGGVLTVATLLIASFRIAQHAALLRRLAFIVVLAVAIPSYLLMRVGAQLVLTAEHLDKNSPGWVGLGFAVADGGIIILLLLAVSRVGWRCAAPRRHAGRLGSRPSICSRSESRGLR